MATLIRLKRRTSAGNSGVILQAGEAYYNTADKKLYIGNTDNDDVSAETKKHIAQITNLSTNDDQVVFTVGEHPDNNKFTKTINNVANSHNVDTTISGKNLSDIFLYDSGVPVSALYADDVTNFNFTHDSSGTNSKLKIDWGAASRSKVKEIELTGLKGDISDAKNLTETISGQPLRSLFRYDSEETTGKPVASLLSDDVTNLSFTLDNSGSTSALKLTWGSASENTKTVPLDTIKGVQVTGSIDTATDLIGSINSVPLSDIFESDWKVAKEAAKLKNSTDKGSATKPVYFKNGVPAECTSVDLNSATATKLATPRKIKIEMQGGNTVEKDFDGSSAITLKPALTWQTF